MVRLSLCVVWLSRCICSCVFSCWINWVMLVWFMCSVFVVLVKLLVFIIWVKVCIVLKWFIGILGCWGLFGFYK